jgi:phage tail sheath protein FI
MSELTTPGVYVQEQPSVTAITPAPTTITVFVGRTQTGVSESATTVTGLADYVSRLGPLSAALPLTLAVRDFFDNGGLSAIILSIGAPGTPLSDAEWLAAINGLGAGPRFNILAVTPDVPGEDVPAIVTAAAAALCATMGAMAILGPLASWQAAADAKTLNSISVENLGPLPLSSRRAAAVFFPSLQVPDPTTAATIVVSPVGAVAGVWVATDIAKGVWTPPAGIDCGLIGAGGLTAFMDDAATQAVDSAGINALRMFPDYGLVVWGAKTLTGQQGTEDDYRYIQVRRTVIYIEQSLQSSLAWTAFEPNTPRLWATITAQVSQFLTTIWLGGGMMGTTASQAFIVTCNGSNNPPSGIADGIVNLEIALALTAPAEFRVFEFQFTTLSG